MGVRVVVVGAGVTGLTTALALTRRGHRVGIVAESPPEATTSAVAAAVWYPYRAQPRDRVLAWGARTGEALGRLAARGAGGVRIAELVEHVAEGEPDPWYRDAVSGFRRLGPARWRFEAAVVPMSAYLAWLLAEARAGGARLDLRRVSDLAEVAESADAVVCCVGLGASELLGDHALTPVRGQVVVVENPGLERVVVDDTDPVRPTYIVPRGADCVLGGTAEEGAWDLRPDPATAQDILDRCVSLEPRLARARVHGHKVGLRPARSEVRLEADEVEGTPVVHNYGHGGAGVTLSWGCAEDAADLLDAR